MVIIQFNEEGEGQSVPTIPTGFVGHQMSHLFLGVEIVFLFPLSFTETDMKDIVEAAIKTIAGLLPMPSSAEFGVMVIFKDENEFFFVDGEHALLAELEALRAGGVVSTTTVEQGDVSVELTVVMPPDTPHEIIIDRVTRMAQQLQKKLETRTAADVRQIVWSETLKREGRFN